MGNQSTPKSLSIVIPAFNEEEAIGSIIERCLAARRSLAEHTSITDVEVIVVSDGSTDRTAEIASSYEPVKVIAYEKNRGYGAAIKTGFAKSSGDLLGFLDADGTCDPERFVDLCRVAIDGPADVVLGSRMHKESKMPALRRFGNQLFAALMSYLSSKKITDTATGMRIIRKDALPKLYPLPTGLHFTPAMTFRALVHDDVAIREVPMPYSERLGRSKLSVFKDGLRFLSIIIEIALSHCPLKFFGGAASLLFAMAILYGFGPLWTYLFQHVVPDGFIYRQIAVNTLALAALLILTIGVVAERVAAALSGNDRYHSRLGRLVLWLCSTRKMLTVGAICATVGVALNFSGVAEYLVTRQISYHWGYLALGSFLVLAGLQLTAMGVFELLVTRIVERNVGSNVKKDLKVSKGL